MSYTINLLKLGKKLDVVLSVQYLEDSFKYKVDLNTVVYKEKYILQNIFGMGFTIEDACYDYIRKCRGGKLVHSLTDAEIDVI